MLAVLAGCAAPPAEVTIEGRRFALVDPEVHAVDVAEAEPGASVPEIRSQGDARPLHEWDREALANALRTTIVHSNGSLYTSIEPEWALADRIIAEAGTVGRERVVEPTDRPRAQPEADEVVARVEPIIIGSDGRTLINPTTTAPHNAVVRLELYDTTRYLGHCTGTYIGPWTVTTAAHCILNGPSGLYVNRIVFKPAQNGPTTLPYGSMDCRNYDAPTSNDVNIAFPAGWTGSLAASQEPFDYAVIDTFPCQTVPVSTHLAGYVVDSGSATYYTLGYPGDVCPGAPGDDVYQCGMSGSAYVNDFRIETEHIDTAGGQSGMAWYRALSGGRYQAAIHSGWRSFFDFGMCGFNNCIRNFGVRVDSAVETFIQANSFDF